MKRSRSNRKKEESMMLKFKKYVFITYSLLVLIFASILLLTFLEDLFGIHIYFLYYNLTRFLLIYAVSLPLITGAFNLRYKSIFGGEIVKKKFFGWEFYQSKSFFLSNYTFIYDEKRAVLHAIINFIIFGILFTYYISNLAN